MTNVLRALTLSLAALAASCSDFHAKEAEGGETHFLHECSEDACPEGLSCVCGVCTIACDGDNACTRFSELAVCRDTKVESLACASEAPPQQSCDATCSTDEQCEPLGEDYRCTEARCRPASNGEDDRESAPLVMIVMDTSGSMERRVDCECTTARCGECLPTCGTEGSDKNRWTQALEALTGTFEDFSCEAKARDDEDAYDFDFEVPYHQPIGMQRPDGLVRMYADRLRLGFATFDGIASHDRAGEQVAPEEFSFGKSIGQEGLWSYPAATSLEELEVGPYGFRSGVYRYPGSPHPYLMNTGIRNREAESGALVIAGRSGADESAVARIEQTLRTTRPFGGTPIAAALDDVRWLFEQDPSLANERMHPEREHHMVLITDGRPDDDYRQLGCDCFAEGNPDGCGLSPFELPTEMTCPYPSPKEAARQLRCGVSEGCDDGAFDSVHILGLSVSQDTGAVETIEAMASASGGSAVIVEDGAALRSALAELLDSIVDGSYRDELDAPGLSELGERRTCMVGELIYANGASWQQGCNRCDCNAGQISCTRAACSECVNHSDCQSDEACHLGPDCMTGLCGPASVDTCDAPVNTATICTCNQQTIAREDCTIAIKGVSHAGDCE